MADKQSWHDELYGLPIFHRENFCRIFEILMKLPDRDIDLYIWSQLSAAKDTVQFLEDSAKKVLRERTTGCLPQRTFKVSQATPEFKLLDAEGVNAMVHEVHNAGTAAKMDHLLSHIAEVQEELTTLAQQLQRRRDVLLQEEAVKQHVRGMTPIELSRYQQALQEAVGTPGA